MNKGKIAEELNGWAKKELGSEFRVKIDCGDLKLFFYRQDIAWFFDFEQNKFDFRSTANYDWGIKLIKEDIIKKFYEKGFEVLSNHEPKCTVQIIENNEHSYLSINKIDGKIIFGGRQFPEHFKTEFTQSEIEELKKRDTAIDWNKVIIKEVE